MTDELIPDYRRRTKLQQPNYTRSRVAYRSPLNSEIMNLESEQLRFDLTNLRAQTDRLKSSLDRQLDYTKAKPVIKIDPTDLSYVDLPGIAGNYLTVPDAPNFDVADLTIVARIKLVDWTPPAVNNIVAIWATTAPLLNQRGFTFDVNTTGILRFIWSVAGTAATGTANSTVVVSAADGTWKWVAVTFDRDDGAGNNVTRFWTSNDNITWTQLGTNVTIAGATSIFPNAAPLEIGSHTSGTLNLLKGSIGYLSVRDGIGAGGTIGGTEVFRFDADNDIPNSKATTFTATTGQTITVNKSGVTPTTLVENSYNVLLDIPAIAAKVDLIREQVRRLEIAKGINS